MHLLKCFPNYNLWFGDGASFELSTDLARMKLEIEKWEGKAGFERYLAWLAEAHRHYELSVTHVLKRNFTSFASMMRMEFLGRVLLLHPFESIYSRASKYFWSERLRRVFTFGSMYMGMSPFNAPGTYSLLQYTELAEGIWYPVGGFHKVVEALVNVGERLGVEYRLSCPVEKVDLSSDGKRAIGVTLASGEHLTADIVIINADLVYAANNLLPPPPPSLLSTLTTPLPTFLQPDTPRSLSARPASCSSISFYWALSRRVPELNAHNIFLADEYRESFDQIFDKQNMPNEPSFYVNVPSRVDPTAAPDGCDAIVVLVPIGHLVEQDSPDQSGLKVAPQDFPSMIASARAKIISTIEKRTGCAPLGPSIIHEEVNDPQTWRATFNLDKGAILGLSHSFFNVLSFRPRTRWHGARGVYFVGASTHPGTGVPIVLAGARMTVEQVLADVGVEVPWLGKDALLGDQGVRQGRDTSDIDRLHARPLLSNVHLALAALLGILLVLLYQMLVGQVLLGGSAAGRT